MTYWPTHEYELPDGRRFLCLSFESAAPIDDKSGPIVLYRIFWTHPEKRHQDVKPDDIANAKHVRKV